MRNGNALCFFLCVKLIFNVTNNESALFLHNEHDIQIEYIFGQYENFVVALLEGFFVFLEKSTSDLPLPHKLRVLVNVVIKKVYRTMLYMHKKFYNNWDKSILDKHTPNAIIYDHRNAYSFPVSLLTMRAKLNSIPIVGMPHGLLTFTNPDFESFPPSKVIRNPKYPKEGTISGLDYLVVINDLGKKLREDLGFDDNISVLGSLRYEKNWIRRMDSIYHTSKSDILPETKSLKVAIFPSKLLYRGDPLMIRDIVSSVCDVFDNVLIKPHTRGMKLEFLQDVLDNNSIKIANNSTSSHSIIKWCDVAIVWSTSVGLHVLAEGKIFLNPAFAHKNETIYNEYLPQCTSYSLDEFKQHLELVKDNQKKCYDNNQVNKIMNDHVYYGDMNSTVVSRYVDFLSKIAKND